MIAVACMLAPPCERALDDGSSTMRHLLLAPSLRFARG